jgi:hypothetical protein
MAKSEFGKVGLFRQREQVVEREEGPNECRWVV